MSELDHSRTAGSRTRPMIGGRSYRQPRGEASQPREHRQPVLQWPLSHAAGSPNAAEPSRTRGRDADFRSRRRKTDRRAVCGPADVQKHFEDEGLGDLLVRWGLVPRGVIAHAVMRQIRLMARGRFRRICDGLILDGWITAGQAEAAFIAVGKDYRYCPRCGQRLRIRQPRFGKWVRCARCNHPFTVLPARLCR